MNETGTLEGQAAPVPFHNVAEFVGGNVQLQPVTGLELEGDVVAGVEMPVFPAAGGAPMLGFLGTVTGMIKAFFNMANAGNNIDISLLSGGIYEAMITTVGGLIVGLIAYFAYNFLTAKVSNVVFKMENATIDFMSLLSETSGEQTETANE